MTTIRWLAAAAAVTLLAGCGPTAGSVPSPTTTASGTGTPSGQVPPTTTPKPSSTQSLSAEQKAALHALEELNEVYVAIGTNPASYSRAEIRAKLKPFAMNPLLDNYVGYFEKLKKAGLREVGQVKVLSVKVGKAKTLEGGVRRLVITRCLDQREYKAVKLDGSLGPASEQAPEWQLQESALRKLKGSKVWRQAGTKPVSTKACG